MGTLLFRAGQSCPALDLARLTGGRTVDKVGIHCSASDRPEHDSVAVIRGWHTAPRDEGGRGWSDIGYHLYGDKAGGVWLGRPFDRTPAAHRPWNSASIAVCLGGLARDGFTEAQFVALAELARALDAARPGGPFLFFGHHQVPGSVPKACPVFDPRPVLGLDAAGLRAGEADPSPQTGPPAHLPARAAAEKYAPHDLLALFDRGPAVQHLQRRLRRAGWWGDDDDGIFDQALRLAVIDFQRARGLAVDGVVGPVTWDALEAAAPVPRQR